MHIDTLIPPADMFAAIDAGHIRVNEHPDLHLRLYNYTEIAQYQKAWTTATRTCRGLIVSPAGRVLARPFPKFFNHGETQHAPFHAHEPVTVTDKLDGSLGITYPTPRGWAIATRGSFTSEQALHATALLRDRYPHWAPPHGVTVLFEIIYPQNRIVLDYGDTDDLVLLGGVNIATGRTLTPWDIEWVGPKADVLPFNTFAEALTAPPRRNAEGYVVHFRESDVRVKIKQDDYVALHRIVTGWNERTIWEQLAAGQTLDLLIEGLPDEFHRWATTVAESLTCQQENYVGAAHAAHQAILDRLPEGFERKEYAVAAADHGLLRPALFHLLDGRDIDGWAWKQVRPSGGQVAA